MAGPSSHCCVALAAGEDAHSARGFWTSAHG